MYNYFPLTGLLQLRDSLCFGVYIFLNEQRDHTDVENVISVMIDIGTEVPYIKRIYKGLSCR